MKKFKKDKKLMYTYIIIVLFLLIALIVALVININKKDKEELQKNLLNKIVFQYNENDKDNHLIINFNFFALDNCELSVRSYNYKALFDEDKVLEDSIGTCKIKDNILVYKRNSIKEHSIELPDETKFEIIDDNRIKLDKNIYSKIKNVTLVGLNRNN